MAEEIDVSFVMTVYNKEYYLPSVLTALLAQSGLKIPNIFLSTTFRVTIRWKLFAV